MIKKYVVIVDDGSPLHSRKPYVSYFEEDNNDLAKFVEMQLEQGHRCHVFKYEKSLSYIKNIKVFSEVEE